MRRLRLLAVWLLLLGLLVGATGVGHDHAGGGDAHDTCAVCVHARSVALAPEAVTPLEPVVLATAAHAPALLLVATGRTVRLRGRAPPRSTSSSS